MMLSLQRWRGRSGGDIRVKGQRRRRIKKEWKEWWIIEGEGEVEGINCSKKKIEKEHSRWKVEENDYEEKT
jgi:hypothetical protein